MKPLYNEQYYREQLDWFLTHRGTCKFDDCINLEEELNVAMDLYKRAGLPDEALVFIRKAEAQKIADSCKKLLMKELGVVRRITAGASSFGYTCARQEVEAIEDFRARFDFNCLQYADFRKKYDLA